MRILSNLRSTEGNNGTDEISLKVCGTENVVLPNPERTQNLGYGIWLFTSASSAFALIEVGIH